MDPSKTVIKRLCTTKSKTETYVFSTGNTTNVCHHNKRDIEAISIKDKYYGDYYKKQGGGSHGYDADKYGHTESKKGHKASKYEDHGNEEGSKYYDKGEKHGHDSQYYEEGGKHEKDSDGMKKYSYFSSGSGPEGEYSKGYYGSEGYEDSKHMSKYVADSSGGGYKKGHDDKGEYYSDHHDKYNSDSSGYEEYGKKHDSGEHKHGKSYQSSEGKNEGWKNSGYESEHDSYGKKY
ncbi:hypothetical protein ANCCEY_00972 [Ancylostoma ceylanicum]|uniref:Uncharacterized protein n=1 Tax=Ancylostoma ceylanicum TaxID=53326 RepID=A0A0D6MAZ5_9BILA|nr:hypothetical protein ANCCEY_00972 [Ancylostoma ceylanicum]